MAELTFILGNSGTGKSTSIRNFEVGEVGYITATGKRLPFKTDIKPYHAKNYTELQTVIAKSQAPVIIIDDFNYFMTNQAVSRAKEVGYGKFTEMAQDFINTILAISNKKSNQTFYIMAHIDEDETGKIQTKTVGKFVSQVFVPEGYVNQVVQTIMEDGDFKFIVKANGYGTKSPLGMFEDEKMENDLKAYDDTLRKFYNMPSREEVIKNNQKEEKEKK